jgi:hypothetical protein
VILAQSVKKPAVDPVRPHAQDESVHQDDRVTLAEHQIPDRDATGIEFLRLFRQRHRFAPWDVVTNLPEKVLSLRSQFPKAPFEPSR